MSNEENTVDSNEEQTNTTETPVTETAESVEKAEPTPAQDQASNMIASIMQLKEDNPKVFFGAIGGVVLLLLIAMMSGGNSSPAVKGQEMKSLVKGNKYVLKSANGQDAGATVRLVSSPDNIAAYDDTEEADRNTPCQHIRQGTSVTVLDLQDMYGTKNAFAKVQMEDGDCKGKDGWVLSIDVQ